MITVTSKDTHGLTKIEMMDYINSVSDFKYAARSKKVLQEIFCMMKRRESKTKGGKKLW